jgi:hypothetical protein
MLDPYQMIRIRNPACGSKGGDTLAWRRCGGQIQTKGQTLWYSMYTIIPLRLHVYKYSHKTVSVATVSDNFSCIKSCLGLESLVWMGRQCSTKVKGLTDFDLLRRMIWITFKMPALWCWGCSNCPFHLCLSASTRWFNTQKIGDIGKTGGIMER